MASILPKTGEGGDGAPARTAARHRRGWDPAQHRRGRGHGPAARHLHRPRPSDRGARRRLAGDPLLLRRAAGRAGPAARARLAGVAGDHRPHRRPEPAPGSERPGGNRLRRLGAHPSGPGGGAGLVAGSPCLGPVGRAHRPAGCRDQRQPRPPSRHPIDGLAARQLGNGRRPRSGAHRSRPAALRVMASRLCGGGGRLGRPGDGDAPRAAVSIRGDVRDRQHPHPDPPPSRGREVSRQHHRPDPSPSRERGAAAAPAAAGADRGRRLLRQLRD